MENKQKCLLNEEEYNEILNLKTSANLSTSSLEIRLYRSRINSILDIGKRRNAEKSSNVVSFRRSLER